MKASKPIHISGKGKVVSVPTGTAKGRLIRAIIDAIAHSYYPARIILFGSYARGTPRDGSDIDILVVKNTKENPRQRWLTVRRIVRPMTGQIPISPLVMTENELKQRIAAGDYFIKEILREGKVLYAA